MLEGYQSLVHVLDFVHKSGLDFISHINLLYTSLDLSHKLVFEDVSHMTCSNDILLAYQMDVTY